MAQHGIAMIELHPEVLAAPRGTDDRAALEPVREVGRTWEVAAHGAYVVDDGVSDRVPDDVILDAEAHDFDLWQLGHE